MAKIKTDVRYQDVAQEMKSRGSRQPSETTRAIESAVLEKLERKDFGKDNGFLLELEDGEELKRVKPKVATVGKKHLLTLGTETRSDEKALWIWIVGEGRRVRLPQQSQHTEGAAEESAEEIQPRTRGRRSGS